VHSNMYKYQQFFTDSCSFRFMFFVRFLFLFLTRALELVCLHYGYFSCLRIFVLFGTFFCLWIVASLTAVECKEVIWYPSSRTLQSLKSIPAFRINCVLIYLYIILFNIAVSKDMQAVKLCSSKILQFLTEVASWCRLSCIMTVKWW